MLRSGAAAARRRAAPSCPSTRPIVRRSGDAGRRGERSRSASRWPRSPRSTFEFRSPRRRSNAGGFEARDDRAARRRWRTRPAVRGSREIEGATCAELAEAASVAIAVSVRSIAGEAGPTQPAAAAAAATPPLAAASPPVGGAAVVGARCRRDALLASGRRAGAGHRHRRAPQHQHRRRPRRRASSAGRCSSRLLATWFGSQDATGADHTGGTFQLAVGGARACFAPRRGRWTPLACGGFELGRLAGTGQGVARPETGEALWRAVRADVGRDGGAGRQHGAPVDRRAWRSPWRARRSCSTEASWSTGRAAWQVGSRPASRSDFESVLSRPHFSETDLPAPGDSSKGALS